MLSPLPAAARGPADKVALRQDMLARRAALDIAVRASFERLVPARAEEICRAWRNDAIVALYSSTGDEASTAAVAARLAAARIATALPVVVGRDRPLAFRAWRSGAPLEPGRFGIPHPPADAPLVVPDILLVPLLAFDAGGWRLGYGGGFYDRTLAALRAEKPILAVGLAFSAQAVAAVPREPHDRPLDAVLTEDGLAVDHRRR